MTELFVAPSPDGTPAPLSAHRLEYRGEESEMVHIIAFDPGGTTGWAQFSIWLEAFQPGNKILDNVQSWSCGQFDGPEDIQVDRMCALVESWPVESDVVVEDFILQVHRRGRELLAPVRITAAFSQELRWIGRPKRGRGREGGKDKPRTPILQMPSLAMTCMTDDRLKAAGYYDCTKGKPHARDAVRHGLTWARRKKEGFQFVE